MKCDAQPRDTFAKAARHKTEWRAGNPSEAHTLPCHLYPKELTMDREHLKGAADKAKGTIKDAAGKVAGDKKLQTEGKLDKAKGAAHNAAGDVKDAIRKAGE
jgi:uncharacterized protein YjbJ (UPF0337 family)